MVVNGCIYSRGRRLTHKILCMLKSYKMYFLCFVSFCTMESLRDDDVGVQWRIIQMHSKTLKYVFIESLWTRLSHNEVILFLTLPAYYHRYTFVSPHASLHMTRSRIRIQGNLIEMWSYDVHFIGSMLYCLCCKLIYSAQEYVKKKIAADCNN